jgi:hypothetical protein
VPDPKRGRPPLDAAHPSVKVCFSLPTPQYDHLYERAQRERVSIGEVIRRKLDDDHDDD